jgi:hypothetical protein
MPARAAGKFGAMPSNVEWTSNQKSVITPFTARRHGRTLRSDGAPFHARLSLSLTNWHYRIPRNWLCIESAPVTTLQKKTLL